MRRRRNEIGEVVAMESGVVECWFVTMVESWRR